MDLVTLRAFRDELEKISTPEAVYNVFLHGRSRKAGKTPSDYNPDEVRRGAKVEREHSADNTVQKRIAADHLQEDPRYYEKLEKMESGYYDKLEREKKAYEIKPEDRPSIPKREFAQPKKEEAGHKGKYPIPDKQHYRSALGFAKMHGDTAAYAAIKAKGRKMGYEDDEKEKTSALALASRIALAYSRT